ncbi:hypothetical protein E2C01_053881 [Portunus trituberculatus]|uniref:Uncharacterized protein n=1 Tax=Portunus trituberculatus TaxID=210409 RepID=A0A5B7GQH8_PORTR|nr:hypothetical protein [Portunus trituberculatus]
MVMLKGESSGDAGSNWPSIGSAAATDDPVRITQLPIKVERAPADSRKVQQQAVVWENLTERAVAGTRGGEGKREEEEEAMTRQGGDAGGGEGNGARPGAKPRWCWC